MNTTETEVPAVVAEAILFFQENNPSTKILLAAESGSRMWGFASKNSDYDVRMIFAHKKNAYLSFTPTAQTYDVQDVGKNTDTSAWDLKKACKLIVGGNANLHDWLYSPVVYQSEGTFREEMQSLFRTFHSSRELAFSHFGLAKKHYHRYLAPPKSGPGALVKMKTYLYTMRAIMCADFIYRNESSPPVKFSDLQDQFRLPDLIADQIMWMLWRKQQETETTKMPWDQLMNEYIEQQLDILEDSLKGMPKSPSVDLRLLDEFFLKWTSDEVHDPMVS